MIDEKIIKFINKHHVLTLATSVDNRPWCANCFYVYLENEQSLVFTSDDETQHAQEALINPHVSGSIVLETDIVGKIRGIQFAGEMYKPEEELHKKAKQKYLKRFPYASIMKTNLWVVRLDRIKLTDNRLGFGKKLNWSRDNEGV